ncbi:HAD family hydrolase [Streptomyces sp. I05A-00742]|uniref:HAD family hydrolase n=1 Tax=Streptomyces sp. I05A-00742 TaxID=2732853 RepID=UPI0014887E7D|nr:HAD family hydrolase [Streptomyces sp. I05A-00742]
MPIRAVLWDIDDTLFDYTGSDRAGVRRHLEAEGLTDRYGPPDQAFGLWREIWREQFARFRAGEIDFREHRRERVRVFLDAPLLTAAEADAWFGRYTRHYEAAWTLFPDARPALDTVAPHFRQAVLSNAAAVAQRRKLTTLGVRGHFEHLLCADELGCAKPEPEAFLAACAALGLPPAEVLYVGDELETDAVGACEAGLLGVWLDRTGTEPPAALPDGVRRIRGLHELPGLLDPVIDFGAPSTFG